MEQAPSLFQCRKSLSFINGWTRLPARDWWKRHVLLIGPLVYLTSILALRPSKHIHCPPDCFHSAALAAKGSCREEREISLAKNEPLPNVIQHWYGRGEKILSSFVFQNNKPLHLGKTTPFTKFVVTREEVKKMMFFLCKKELFCPRSL